jgi:glycosyltransferase involved in cell wall biosynthesis
MVTVRIIKNYQWNGYDLIRQTPKSKGYWGNIHFTEEPVDECDYLVVLNFAKFDTTVVCPPENIWALMQEPYLPDIFPWVNKGHEHFAKVFIPSGSTFTDKYIPSHTCLPWFDYDVESSYDNLLNICVPNKVSEISLVSSSKKVFPGHKARLEFIRFLQSTNIVDIDMFGRGINPIKNKWDALAPYKYSIAMENTKSAHYWTEKVADCFLAYTLPIYYGCTNLEDYFPSESFVRIDIANIKESMETIEQVVKNDIWKERLPAIKEARELILNKYQLFPFLADRIQAENGNNKTKKAVYIRGFDKENGYMKSKPQQLVTVIVCTYNREAMLPDCLSSLVQQTFNPEQFQVIIVDNNSSDNTQKVVEKFIRRHNNFKVVVENEQGLSNARNRGVREASGEYIAFIDDDARAPDNWLETAARIIAEHKPDILGGPAIPIHDTQTPPWFKESYGIRGDMGESGWLKHGHIVGTNIFFRKQLLEEYGGFNPNLGMKGDSIGYHEETALVYRAFSENRKVYYCRDLMVFDNMPSYKYSLAFFMYARYKAGYDGVQLWGQLPSANNVATLIAEVENAFNEMDYALRKRDQLNYEFPDNYVIERMAQNFIEIGRLIKLININSTADTDSYNFGNFSALNIVRNIHRTTGLVRFSGQLIKETIYRFLKK